jgi:bud site selection protein 20
MGKPEGRRKHRESKISKYGIKTRRFDANSMIDQVYDDVKLGRKEDLPVDLDKPGMGQIYCVACAKYFRDERTLGEHAKTKSHKKRLKELREEPHRGHDLPVDNGGAGSGVARMDE